ncbi:hypothetical protein Q427_21570 [Halomonas sp. BC04]|nr:hypothetical protein Q427_21570 [Halomonas sp. BC04]
MRIDVREAFLGFSVVDALHDALIWVTQRCVSARQGCAMEIVSKTERSLFMMEP